MQELLLLRQSIRDLLKWIYNYFAISRKQIYKISNGNGKIAALVYLGHGSNVFHNNYAQQKDIEEALNELGYIVDIYPNYMGPIFCKRKYDLVIGFGVYWRFLCKKNYSSKKILYATEAPPFFSFINEMLARNRVGSRAGALRTYRFYKDEDYFIADAVMQMGEINSNLLIDVIGEGKVFEVGTYGIYSNVEKKIKLNTKNFIWFGSHGAKHKGLDLVLKVFSELKDVNLFVVGCSEKEQVDFISYKSKNIRFIGWLDVKSKSFADLISDCAYCILPSASEGISTAVITCMYAGVVPIITKATNIVCDDAIYVEMNTDSILSAVIKCCQITQEDYAKVSERIKNYSNYKYAKSKFKAEIKSVFKEILSK